MSGQKTLLTKRTAIPLVAIALAFWVSAAWAADYIFVESPWKIEAKLPSPKSGAKLNCALIDKQCNVTGGQSVPVGIKAGVGGPVSGTEKFTFGGPLAKTAVGVECKISAPNMSSGPESKDVKPIPGRQAACMVQENGKWNPLDLTEMQKRRAAWAKARANQMEADRKARAAARAAQDAAEKKSQDDFRKMRAATKAAREDDLRRRAVARKQMKEFLAAEAKRKAQEAEEKKFIDVRAEAFWCTNNPKNKTAKDVLARCKSTKGRFSMKGKCINGECLESDRTEPTYDAVCSYNIDCDNKAYEGICKKEKPTDKNGKCISRKRESCSSPGDIYPCFPVGSPYGGTAVCGKNGVLGSCTRSYDDHKKGLSAENAPLVNWKNTRTQFKSSFTADPNGSSCKLDASCHSYKYEGRCVCGKKNNSGVCVSSGQCKSVKRQTCSTPYSHELCFSNDGRRTAGKRECQPNKAPHDGRLDDCVSDPSTHKAYNKILADYTANKKDWDGYLGLNDFDNSAANPADPSRSACSSSDECNNQGFAGFCDRKCSNFGSHGYCDRKGIPKDKGVCRAVRRKDCSEQGRVEACIEPLTGKFGFRICQPGNVKDKKWSNCKTADDKKRDVPDLKRAGKM